MKKTRSIVAVVDDPRPLESLEELPESAGYPARGIGSPSGLLSHGLSDLDLLITDMCLPCMNGLELRDLVKRTRPELPVLLITAHLEIADWGHAQGINACFRKPFDAPTLVKAIGETLQLSKDGGKDE